jgi:flagellar biogenesis protein FliO
MSTLPTKPGSRFGDFGPWIAIAFVATLAGLFLPQLLSGETVSSSALKADAKTAGPLEYTAAPLPEPPNFRAMMLRLGGGTAAVLGLCVASLWGARRWMSAASTSTSARRTMHLVETLPLGNRCSLHLVHLGNRELIVGVDGGGIKTVLPLAEPFGDVLADAEKAPPEESPFEPPYRTVWTKEARRES